MVFVKKKREKKGRDGGKKGEEARVCSGWEQRAAITPRHNHSLKYSCSQVWQPGTSGPQGSRPPSQPNQQKHQRKPAKTNENQRKPAKTGRTRADGIRMDCHSLIPGSQLICCTAWIHRHATVSMGSHGLRELHSAPGRFSGVPLPLLIATRSLHEYLSMASGSTARLLPSLSP